MTNITETEYIVNQLGNHAAFHVLHCADPENCDASYYSLRRAAELIVNSSGLSFELKNKLFKDIKDWNTPNARISA